MSNDIKLNLYTDEDERGVVHVVESIDMVNGRVRDGAIPLLTLRFNNIYKRLPKYVQENAMKAALDYIHSTPEAQVLYE